MTDQTGLAKKDPLLSLLSEDGVKRRFDQLLGGRAGAAFISSINACVGNNSALQSIAKDNPRSIVAAGVMAATVNLPVTPGLGWAAIVPYKGVAQFQIMKDGFVQLALRTGQYRSINCSDVYEDEFKSWNPHTGELKTTPMETWTQREEGKTDKIVGYLAFFELLNGFKKYSYWTIKQLEAHGKKYSASYKAGKGLWVENKPAMYLKTPLKLLISHFGPMSTQMVAAMEYDQSAKGPDGQTQYPDGRVVDTQTVPEGETIQPPKKLGRPPKEDIPAKKNPEPKKGEPMEPETDSRPMIPDGWREERCPSDVSCQVCDEPIAKLDKALFDPDEKQYSHSTHFRS